MEVRTTTVTAGWSCMHWSAEIAILQIFTLHCTGSTNSQVAAFAVWAAGRHQLLRQNVLVSETSVRKKQKVLQDFLCHQSQLLFLGN